ncbi:MAG: hypothetical protein LUC91_00975 [Prevotella sp.]|nr:hypothetical protein [Prevotella sp.]
MAEAQILFANCCLFISVFCLKDEISLIIELKDLKTKIKVKEQKLHEMTKEKIEAGLTDEDVYELLSKKWIETLCDKINELPHLVVDSLAEKIIALQKKYATTLLSIDEDIKESSRNLSNMIEEITGNVDDLLALAELKNLLADD